MSNFKNQQTTPRSQGSSFQSYTLKNESPQDQGKGKAPVQMESQTQFEVKGFEMPDFRKQANPGYAHTREKYGPLAVTDPAHQPRTQKDARFRLNSLQREPLAVDQEERRVIDDLVSERVRETENQIREQAQEEGYQKGLALGRDEAMQVVREEGELILSQLRQFMEQIEASKDDILKAQEKLIVEMVLRFAKTIVLRELSMDRDYVVRLAKQLISSTDLRDHLRLKVNARDLANVSQIQSELTRSFSDLKNLRIEESPLIQQGGVILESQWSTTDAAVETQIQRLFETVLEGNPSAQTPVQPGGGV